MSLTRVYLDVVKFKTKDEEYLGIILIFTPIPLDAQDVWSLNQLCVCVLKRMKKCLTLTYIPIHVLTKIMYVFLHLTDNLIGLTFWAFPIGLQYVAWSRPIVSCSYQLVKKQNEKLQIFVIIFLWEVIYVHFCT